MELDAYYTARGRKVHGGGGIAPDEVVLFPPLNDFVVDLRRKSLFFNFAVHYTNSHSAPDKNFSVTDPIIHAFRDYLDEKSYEYRHPIEERLDALKVDVSLGAYSASLIRDIEQLQNSLSTAKREMFNSSLEDIRSLLRSEIASKFFGTQRGIELRLEDDPVIQRGIAFIRDTSRYASILSSGN
jgi:carboxyl-terminal processing protease